MTRRNGQRGGPAQAGQAMNTTYYPPQPRPGHLASILKRLGELRNELDVETFKGDQRFRKTLYPLNDAVEALENAVTEAKA